MIITMRADVLIVVLLFFGPTFVVCLGESNGSRRMQEAISTLLQRRSLQQDGEETNNQEDYKEPACGEVVATMLTQEVRDMLEERREGKE